ncbi:RAD16 [Symbiodinium natans]|uniref:RAD16 protein n=1 Tax=Symbiodinium natans TaxID=878477 RepID=A0A812TUY6_9DINO|nr:RAD16 [Symbiodinium natans]
MQGLVTLAGSANQLPERLAHCAFDTSGQDWVPRGQIGKVPEKRRPYLLHGYTHKAEKSKTGAAACKRCGDKIPKHALRIGYPVKDQRGEYGALVNWFHLACARHDNFAVGYAKMGDDAMSKKILGYADMPADLLLVNRPSSPKGEDKQRGGWPGVATENQGQLPQHPAPKALTRSMLAFQAEGLGWMLEREADEATRGGILADDSRCNFCKWQGAYTTSRAEEMGMGKTLQTISLILAGEIKGATLVVCPAAAMLQWRNEILRFTEPGSLEVRLYYGLEKKSALEDLMDDTIYLRRTVVLTTYQTLESDYRQQVNRTKVQCQWCGRLFQKEKLEYHQKYFCGPDAQKTEKQMKSQRKADFKDEAVKKMKIGGTETNIVLNPLNAIRSVSTAALRARLTTLPPHKKACRSSM